jgi:hypothetical protein
LSWSKLDRDTAVKAALAQRKPVVAGIRLFENFRHLNGTNPVYNSASGAEIGGHAVTIVGYDDNRYGGAFKFINSWTTNWGDNGFFWIPYNFYPLVASEAYLLEDAPNTNVKDDNIPTPPTPTEEKQPDLQIQSWNAQYDSFLGAQGKLEWSLINTGQGVAPQGIAVGLWLSKDATINANDTLVIYEQTTAALNTGQSIYRSISQGNGITFQIPTSIDAGEYYMAMVVDDLNQVKESNETNNVNLGGNKLNLANNQPDLSVYSWYADWNDFSGLGVLIYDIYNAGGTPAASGWDLGLALVGADTASSNSIYLLFTENYSYTLPVGYFASRNESTPAYFNIYTDLQGQYIPFGYYYMVFFVDLADAIKETDETNNLSYEYVDVGGSFFGASATAKARKSPDAEGHHRAYNGRSLPQHPISIRKVKITETAPGVRSMEVLDEPSLPLAKDEIERRFSKTVRSSEQVIFPQETQIPMPKP